jgi:hypothetical protein
MWSSDYQNCKCNIAIVRWGMMGNEFRGEGALNYGYVDRIGYL